MQKRHPKQTFLYALTAVPFSSRPLSNLLLGSRDTKTKLVPLPVCFAS